MNSIDINEVDKTHFKCYKFPDSSLYYGEIAYLDESNKLVDDLEKYNEDMMKKLKLVRHGVGVQLFGATDNSSLCRYEGTWVKDKKNGQGICFFPDKSVFDGTFADDLFDGYGKFSWNNNDIYIGEWKGGRMDGEGEFKHNDGHILKGKFRNNYFFDKERFINPFMSLEELKKFKIKNSEYTAKMKSENEKFSIANIFKIKNHNELRNYIEKSINDNKTPLILRLSNSIIDKNDIFKLIQKDFKEIDLRYFSNQLRGGKYDINALNELKKIVEESISKGFHMILNYDDCSTKYEDLFDPEIEEFYGSSLLSSHMWTPSVFSQEKVWHDHLIHRQDLKYDKNFRFIVYSKLVIDVNMNDRELINFIEKRFERCIPLININVLILSN